MSHEDEATGSQDTIWDFDIDAVAGLTNSASLTTLSAHPIEGSRGIIKGKMGMAPGRGQKEESMNAEDEFTRVESISLKMDLSPAKGLSVTFADSSTKNMIEHLQEIHKIGKDGPIPLEHGQVLIETAFGKTRPQVTFNSDLFHDLLLRWIIEIHISFSQVEKGSFRVLLRYLVACVSIIYIFNFKRQ
ncbi:hypothetical protein HOY80DRAFT_1047915 [Tuber brumale]|nr:hypothetical protein HOY80DRAFT_1047915 [Tuber brumale]